jgi:hypothetical protein
MGEADFWVALEFRLCGEFAGLPQRRYQYFWCDGLIPSKYLLHGDSPRITGRCWIGNGPGQAEWAFALLLPRGFGSRDEIDWASLLPPPNATRWMAFDEARQYIEIEPAAGVPDLAE